MTVKAVFACGCHGCGKEIQLSAEELRGIEISMAEQARTAGERNPNETRQMMIVAYCRCLECQQRGLTDLVHIESQTGLRKLGQLQ